MFRREYIFTVLLRIRIDKSNKRARDHRNKKKNSIG